MEAIPGFGELARNLRAPAFTSLKPNVSLAALDSDALRRALRTVQSETMPRASVYHAHATGYASLLGAAAVRDHGTSFLLTEHNLYVRDTVNTLLDRNMALSITSEDYRTLDVTPEQRGWMAWWTENGPLLLSQRLADHLRVSDGDHRSGAPGNGHRQGRGVAQRYGDRGVRGEIPGTAGCPGTVRPQRRRPHTEPLLIARVVPIKGLLDLLSSMNLLRLDGFPTLHLNVLGPTEPHGGDRRRRHASADQ